MKKIIIAFSGIILLAFAACRKSDINATPDTLKNGSYLRLQTTVNNLIDYSNRNTSSVTFDVVSVGLPVKEVNIYVVAGQDLNTANWKPIKTVPYQDSAVIKVTGVEIATALGISVDDFQPGTSYTLYTEAVTVDGQKFSLGNTATDFESQAPYHMAFQLPVFIVCPFDATASAGTYKVVYDGDWADFSTGDPITVTAGPGPNQISMLAYPNPAFGENRVPTVIDVDPASGTATVAAQVVGTYGGAPATLSGSGFVFSCTGLITLTNNISVAGSDFLGLKFILQRQ